MDHSTHRVKREEALAHFQAELDDAQARHPSTDNVTNPEYMRMADDAQVRYQSRFDALLSACKSCSVTGRRARAMKVVEYDEAPDGGTIYEVDSFGYTTYVHNTLDGEWLTFDGSFNPIPACLRQAQIDLCKAYQKQTT